MQVFKGLLNFDNNLTFLIQALRLKSIKDGFALVPHYHRRCGSLALYKNRVVFLGVTGNILLRKHVWFLISKMLQSKTGVSLLLLSDCRSLLSCSLFEFFYLFFEFVDLLGILFFERLFEQLQNITYLLLYVVKCFLQAHLSVFVQDRLN
jgi:hypothetical protein